MTPSGMSHTASISRAAQQRDSVGNGPLPCPAAHLSCSALGARCPTGQGRGAGAPALGRPLPCGVLSVPSAASAPGTIIKSSMSPITGIMSCIWNASGAAPQRVDAAGVQQVCPGCGMVAAGRPRSAVTSCRRRRRCRCCCATAAAPAPAPAVGWLDQALLRAERVQAGGSSIPTLGLSPCTHPPAAGPWGSVGRRWSAAPAGGAGCRRAGPAHRVGARRQRGRAVGQVGVGSGGRAWVRRQRIGRSWLSTPAAIQAV